MTIHDYLTYFVLPLLSISMLLIFVRFIKGPSVFDRVISLDLLVTCGMGIIAVYSILTDQQNFLDFALILALIAFLGTIAFSFYLKNRHGK